VTAEPCGTTANGWTSDNYNNNFAVGLAWQPKNGGTFVPSISGGWGYSAYSYSNTLAPAVLTSNTGTSATTGISNGLAVTNIAATQSWTVGLQWKDAFVKGNSAGMAVGQPSFVTSTRNGVTPFDGNYAWEWWYKFQVTDNISVTPALFWLSRPLGALTNGYNADGSVDRSSTFGVLGGLVQTTIRF
jgi:hypothetical protein